MDADDYDQILDLDVLRFFNLYKLEPFKEIDVDDNRQ